MPTYPHDAACATSGFPPSTWDEIVAGETAAQREARYATAVAVCATCPVASTCYEKRTDGGGIRDAVILPDLVPGWSGNEWVGLDPFRKVGHGTAGGYKVHRKLGQDACTYCLDGNTKHEREKTARRLARRAVA